MKCPHCGQEHPDDFLLCPYTGNPLASKTKICGNPACKYSNVPIEAKFCPRCGTPFSLREENLFNKQRDISLSQIVIFCSRDCSIQIGQGHWTENNDFLREKQLKLKKGENLICVNEYPELQHGFSFYYKFDNSKNIEKIFLDKLDTSKVTNAECMFYSCSLLKSLDLRGLDTSNVTSMSGMFTGCSSLELLDLTGINTSKVMEIGWMFNDCRSLKYLNLNSFDTSKVTNMEKLFSDCSSLEVLDLSNFDVSKVTNMYGMFWNCNSLKSLDLSGFNTSNVDNMIYMFDGCDSLKKIIMRGCNKNTIDDISKALEEADINAKIITD